MKSFENPFTHSAPPFRAPEQNSAKNENSLPAAKKPETKFADNYEAVAPSFGQNPILKESFISHQENIQAEKERQEKKQLASFFQSGDINKIVDSISIQPHEIIFTKQIERVKQEYAVELSTATFLTEKDWKILTGLELFDKATFEHSLGTYLIAKKKVEERMVTIGSDINKEGVQFEQLYRAALFHDLGKIAIPSFVLNSEITDSEWVFHFLELDKETQDNILTENYIIVPDAIRDDFDQMTKFFYENRIRAVKLVPIGAVLSEQQKEQLEKLQLPTQEDTQAKSICDFSLSEIMQLHEKKSEEILQKLGYFIEGLLAGNHHNYKYKDKKLGEKPVSLSLAHLSIETASNIIHLADVQHAMSGDRPYHHKNPTLRILAFMVDDAEKGVTDPQVTAKWIFDELKKMNPAYLLETRNLLPNRKHHEYMLERQKELEKIDEFLYDNLPESEEYKFDLAA